jgi:hypothetical protein
MNKALIRIACLTGAGLGAWLSARDVYPQNLVPPPITITLPNYNTIPVGQVGGFEGGAFVARADDASSNWFNPAGLSKATVSSISSSAGTYQFLSVVPKELESKDTGTSTEQVPALVGVVVKKMFGDPRFTAGFAFTRTSSWSQTTDAQLDHLDSTPSTLDTYSANSEFTRSEATAGLGYDAGALRLGTVLVGDVTSLNSVASLSVLDVRPEGLDAISIAGRASGSITQLRLGVGAQYDVSPAIHLGGMIRSPGLALFRSGDLNADGLFTAGATGGQLSYTFFDRDPRFDFKLPLEIAVGGAWICDRFQIEVDGRFYTGHSSYDLFRTDLLATTISDPGGGVPPVVERIPFDDIQAEGDAIFNVGIGGQYALTRNHAWILHFGFNTDFSQVGEADEFFSKVDLYGFTLGLSGQTEHITASIGVNYVFGNTDNAKLAQLLNTDISVKMIGIIYSLAYRF